MKKTPLNHLPIMQKKDVIVEAIRKHPVVVITGETGSGKSTQTPKICLEAGRGISGRIGITQPRRIAAISIAAQISLELKEHPGKLAGYKIRFQDKTPANACIKVMTDGILLAETLANPRLIEYDTIIIDEAHERNVNIDFLLGFLRRLIKERNDLRLIITSATIDTEKFSEAFDNAPVIEVSGRVYPVDVEYCPIQIEGKEGEDITFVDAAANAVEKLQIQKRHEDILIFMPTEQDIRDTVELLKARDISAPLILPLYGRLSSAQQGQVFQPSLKQKIVIATNIAETSLTIPGIKYVIDTGLARISRYNPKLAIQRLPIERISQSSADQRKGRCGRVQAGVCIRLYSEEDYLSRQAFNQPEILRSNLAETLLRMKSLKLGDVRRFPFIDPPSGKSIKDGHAILKELGAIDKEERLTSLGKALARLPMDPRLGRMIIEAKKEGALREVLVIASALSVRDPRERPSDKTAYADQAHAAFADTQSDFLVYLRMWEAFHTHMANGASRNTMRIFCKKHFLSYARMRDWIDLHNELLRTLTAIKGFHINPMSAGYDAIHRSILSGYLGHVALKKEKNEYYAAGNKKVSIFPGSCLYNKSGAWIVAAELVETSRVFARIIANINPEWLEMLGAHMVKSRYSAPHWDKDRGEVVAYEKKTLLGLTIVENRKTGYGKIDPIEAKKIFIQSALVEGEISRTYHFMRHNQELIAKIKDMENRTRCRTLLVEEDVIAEFYRTRINADISDIRTFEKFLKDSKNDHFLCMTENDILTEKPDPEYLKQFPGHINVRDHKLPLTYCFDPADDADGVTVLMPDFLIGSIHSVIRHSARRDAGEKRGVLPVRCSDEPRSNAAIWTYDAMYISGNRFEWLVPGLLQEKIEALLKGLPGSLRRHFIPVASYSKEIASQLPKDYDKSLYASLSDYIKRKYAIDVPLNAWPKDKLPPYLKMRFSIHKSSCWDIAAQKLERSGITKWDFGSLPEKVQLQTDNTDMTIFAYPGLAQEQECVAIRLFTTPEKAKAETQKGIMTLLSQNLAKELTRLKNTISLSKELRELFQPFGTERQLGNMVCSCVKRSILAAKGTEVRTETDFMRLTDQVRSSLLDTGQTAIKTLEDILRERKRTSETISRYASLSKNSSPSLYQEYRLLIDEMIDLVPADFLEQYNVAQLKDISRYLKALRLRGERMYANPDKLKDKANKIAAYTANLKKAYKTLNTDASPELQEMLRHFRWMIEELKVSFFAQELHTSYPVSTAKLDEKWEAISQQL
ncbi:MAG: ATP-dependent RNA helicase HrpA [Pseudomonadota bacterium]